MQVVGLKLFVICDASIGVVQVIGVSGSGKTWFLYELLVGKWGFFWTAKTKENSGFSL
jgi:hypothetical protein